MGYLCVIIFESITVVKLPVVVILEWMAFQFFAHDSPRRCSFVSNVVVFLHARVFSITLARSLLPFLHPSPIYPPPSLHSPALLGTSL